MVLKLATAFVLAFGLTAGQALACMGSTVLFSDNFKQVDPAWTSVFNDNSLAISGGFAQVTPPQGDYALLSYGGSFFDSGDACVDITSPASVTDPSSAIAGFVFGYQPSGDQLNYYVLQVGEDGSTSVSRMQNGAWLTPVPWKTFAAVKTGGNVTNTLRVTWSGTSGAAYVNGQLFSNFVLPQPFQNSVIGLTASGDASTTAGATWKFTNLKITNAP